MVPDRVHEYTNSEFAAHTEDHRIFLGIKEPDEDPSGSESQ